MELEDAREIAKYVVPRMLFKLPQDIKVQLVSPGENEDSLLFRLVEKAAADIQWKAVELENQKRKKYI
ncbi:MAG: hypothetical protein HYS15_00975 [Candidatus Spechtbacteria bacterium]|nr:hypothetical protein [Candidatus Spechtbacteria bacterium]